MPTQNLETLREALQQADSGFEDWDDLRRWRETVGGLLRTMLPADHDRYNVFMRYPTHSSYRRDARYPLRGQPSVSEELANKTSHLADVFRGILAELEAPEWSSDHFGDVDWHPCISDASAHLWADGHYREAVAAASRAVELYLRDKLGQVDQTTAEPLITNAFNTDPPRPGQPRLRFSGFAEETQEWTNAHLGAMLFGKGCMLRIRNLHQHHEADLTREEAYESLAALSLLTRWIDTADVVEAQAD